LTSVSLLNLIFRTFERMIAYNPKSWFSVTGTGPFPTPPVVMFFVLIAVALTSARKA